MVASQQQETDRLDAMSKRLQQVMENNQRQQINSGNGKPTRPEGRQRQNQNQNHKQAKTGVKRRNHKSQPQEHAHAHAHVQALERASVLENLGPSSSSSSSSSSSR